MLPAICKMPVTTIVLLFCILISFTTEVPVIVGYTAKPEGIITLLLLVGMPPHAQLPMSFQSLFTAPVQVPAIPITIVVLVIYCAQLPAVAIV